MTAPSANRISQEETQRSEEEMDLWWGSYAGRDMMPSFIACIALTALIFFGTRWWGLQPGSLQLTFSAFASAVWLVQLIRWAQRFFTWNYRLTTRFLYVDRGVKPLIAKRFELRTIDHVAVRANHWQKWLGIADLRICFNDKSTPPVVLKALTAPCSAADTIRQAVKKARESIE